MLQDELFHLDSHALVKFPALKDTQKLGTGRMLESMDKKYREFAFVKVFAPAFCGRVLTSLSSKIFQLTRLFVPPLT